jgi:hypothetical protein
MRPDELPSERWNSAERDTARQVGDGDDGLARRLARLPPGHPSSPEYEEMPEKEESPDYPELPEYEELRASESGEDLEGPGRERAGRDDGAYRGTDRGRREGLEGLGGRDKEPYRPWFSAGESPEPWFTAGPGG